MNRDNTKYLKYYEHLRSENAMLEDLFKDYQNKKMITNIAG